MTDNPTLQSEKLEPCKWCAQGDSPHFLDSDGTKVSITGSDGVLSHAYEEYWWPCLKFGVELRCSRALVVAPQEDTAARIAQILNEDRCMWCGGKTEHKPDCDHGVRPSPASSPVPPEQIGGFTCECCGRAMELRVNGKFCNECATSRAPSRSVREAAEEIAALEKPNHTNTTIEVANCDICTAYRQRIATIIQRHCSPVSVAGGDEGKSKVEQTIHQWRSQLTQDSFVSDEDAEDLTLRLLAGNKIGYRL